MNGGASIEVLGYALGDFSTPALAMVSAFVLGIVLAVVPAGVAELVALAAGGMQPRALVVPVVILLTLGHLSTVTVCPLTTQLHPAWRTRLEVKAGNRNAEIAVDQIRTISKSRIGKKLGTLTSKEAAVLRRLITEMYDE